MSAEPTSQISTARPSVRWTAGAALLGAIALSCAACGFDVTVVSTDSDASTSATSTGTGGASASASPRAVNLLDRQLDSPGGLA